MPEDEDKKKQTEDAEKDDAASEKQSDKEESQEQPKPFESLDIRGITCFGWQKNAKESCWYDKTILAQKFGWEKADVEGIDLSLKENVDNCYFNIAAFEFVDLDDDTPYTAQFDNNKMMWKLSVTNSPKAEIEMETIADFFKSDMMKKCAQRAADKITMAKDAYENTLEDHLENGELLGVDEVKLAAILYNINADGFLKNLRSCKWFSN